MSLTAPLTDIFPSLCPRYIVVKLDHNLLPSLLRHLEVDQVVHHLVRDGQVNHPVHQMEAEESDGEDDPAVLVNIRGLHAKQSLWWRAWRRWRRWWKGWRCLT